jgi:hypothetical protein
VRKLDDLAISIGIAFVHAVKEDAKSIVGSFGLSLSMRPMAWAMAAMLFPASHISATTAWGTVFAISVSWLSPSAVFEPCVWTRIVYQAAQCSQSAGQEFAEDLFYHMPKAILIDSIVLKLALDVMEPIQPARADFVSVNGAIFRVTLCDHLRPGRFNRCFRCARGHFEGLEEEGVKVTLVSAGKYKTEGMPYEPLSVEGRRSLQGQVDEFYGMFASAVARNRGVATSTVKNGFGEGRMVLAQDAVKAGMADGVASLDQTLARLLGRRTGKGLSPAAERSLRRRELELLM